MSLKVSTGWFLGEYKEWAVKKEASEDMSRVLIVNDSRFERQVLRDLILALGYEADTSDDYKSLERVDIYRPDIVIANLNMKNIDGDRLLARIKKKSPEIRCFLCSCSELNYNDYSGLQIDGLIQTPVNLGQLEQILNNERQKQAATGKFSLSSTCDEAYNRDEPFIIQEQRQGNISSGEEHFTFCPYCGKSMESNSRQYKFCPYCGEQF